MYERGFAILLKMYISVFKKKKKKKKKKKTGLVGPVVQQIKLEWPKLYKIKTLCYWLTNVKDNK